MAANNSSLVTVAGGMLLVSVVCWFDSKLLDVASSGLSFGVVFGLIIETDKLFGAVADKSLEATVNKLLVAAVDKLGFDLLAVDRLVAASLAGKYFDIGLDLDLDNDLEFGTSDRGFCIDFLIIGCYKYGN
ncbi:hypothetical protein G9A89_004325 [Geosiphon pyriformis]|nr:hypothetical protein G9A89_004325 [Geosiphon pyriformis]